MEAGTSKVLNQLFKDKFKKAPFADFEYGLNSHPDFPTLKSISNTLENPKTEWITSSFKWFSWAVLLPYMTVLGIGNLKPSSL